MALMTICLFAICGLRAGSWRKTIIKQLTGRYVVYLDFDTYEYVCPADGMSN